MQMMGCTEKTACLWGSALYRCLGCQKSRDAHTILVKPIHQRRDSDRAQTLSGEIVLYFYKKETGKRMTEKVTRAVKKKNLDAILISDGYNICDI